MPRPDTAVFYISGHGFGHASRQIEIINALTAIQPDLRIVVRTSAPRWLFDLAVIQLFSFAPGEPDTGVVQIDSLQVDATASIDRAWDFHRTFDARAQTETRLLERHDATLVAGDIPPLAFAAAAAAGVPAVAIGNFTWDWIYEHYDEQLAATPDLLPVIRNTYATADRAWRLPMAGGFASFRRVVDAPLVARHARHAPAETRRALKLPTDRPLVLVSFGRYGLGAVDWATVTQQDDLGVIVTRDPVDAGPTLSGANGHGALFEVDVEAMLDEGFRYEDLVAAVDVVLTKPGYGIIAECAANDTALVYASRGDFAEYAVLVEAMPGLLPSAYIEQRDLFAGRWTPVVRQVLDQPPLTVRPATDGAQVVARGLAEYLNPEGDRRQETGEAGRLRRVPIRSRATYSVRQPRGPVWPGVPDQRVQKLAKPFRFPPASCLPSPGSVRVHASFMQVTSDQMRGMLTFSIETGSRPACTRNAGRSRSALKPTCTVNGEMNRSARETSLFELRKWLRNTKRPPGRQTRRISCTALTGSDTTLMV